jgi:hypothetical protein
MNSDIFAEVLDSNRNMAQQVRLQVYIDVLKGT